MDETGAPLLMPEGTRREQFVAWANDAIPTLQVPLWLGLPNNAEKLLLTNRGAPSPSPSLYHPYRWLSSLLDCNHNNPPTTYNP